MHSTPKLMYPLGALIGDGSLRHTSGGSYFITFEMKDRNVLFLIQSLFQKVFGIRKKITLNCRKDGRRTYILKYSNKIIYYFFNRFFNITKNKTKTVRILLPANSSRNAKLALLLGLFHTDGSVVKNSLRFYTSSSKLRDDIRTILAGIGYSCRLYAYQRKNYTPEYHIYVKNSKDILSEFARTTAVLAK
ncbi:MAG: LAGLIDADG family homing endonuclease [Candidatus Micrarchaeota archaeon]